MKWQVWQTDNFDREGAPETLMISFETRQQAEEWAREKNSNCQSYDLYYYQVRKAPVREGAD